MSWIWKSPCADPVPGQDDLDSCVMKRENDLRRDLGLTEKSE
jgi:hypothetical protein